MMTKRHQILIWKWFNSEYKVYCETKEQYDEMMSWSGSDHGSVYYYPDGHLEYDVIIPRRHIKRAVKFLRLDPKNMDISDVD